jgi:MFS transporter, FHS family, glucose/mannose:H+ symporter
MSFLGAILPAWRYHLESNFTEVGNYFLCLNLGFLLSSSAAHFWLSRKGAKFMLISANALACAGFLFLALSSLPAFASWRLGGVLGIGVSAGLLNAGMFQAISPSYYRDPAATTNQAGVYFGLGCLLTALLVAGTYYVYTVPSILILLAVLPGFSAGLYAQTRLPSVRVARSVTLSQLWRDFRDPGAVLFGLLLFVQFANEWSIAGWLPLFLTRRLGISPETSLLMLALYWVVLLVGRIVAQWVMKRMSHRLLLAASILSALLGTIVLASTDNRFGAVMGILFIGAGFAPIYPLVIRKIGNRSPHYDPGTYNGLFSFAIFGAFLAPWLLGYLAQAWGIQAVMIVPMVGACVVFVLMVLIWLEAKLSGAPAVRGA